MRSPGATFPTKSIVQVIKDQLSDGAQGGDGRKPRATHSTMPTKNAKAAATEPRRTAAAPTANGMAINIAIQANVGACSRSYIHMLGSNDAVATPPKTIAAACLIRLKLLAGRSTLAHTTVNATGTRGMWGRGPLRSRGNWPRTFTLIPAEPLLTRDCLRSPGGRANRCWGSRVPPPEHPRPARRGRDNRPS